MQINALVFLELISQELNQTQVEVFAAKECIPIGRENLKLMLSIDLGNLDNRHVKRTATEVVDRDLGVALPAVHAVGKCRRRRLVDDALDIKPGDPTGVLGSLTLGVIEIGRHGDHRLTDRLTEVILGCLLHFHEDASRDLRRGHFFALHVDPGVSVVRLDDGIRNHAAVPLDHVVFKLSPDQPLDCEQSIRRVSHGLTLCRLPDENLIIATEGDDRWRGPRTLAVFYDLGFSALQHCDAGVRRTKVYSDDFAHDFPLTFLKLVARLS